MTDETSSFIFVAEIGEFNEIEFSSIVPGLKPEQVKKLDYEGKYKYKAKVENITSYQAAILKFLHPHWLHEV